MKKRKCMLYVIVMATMRASMKNSIIRLILVLQSVIQSKSQMIRPMEVVLV